MKKLDLYIVKNFIVPFFATFFVVTFVLVMQFIWLAFDEIAGKGISFGFIMEFIGYLILMVIPTSVPVAVLLSSLMAMGNLSEKYELVAIKSAGISLKRIIRPLILSSFILAVINFLFLNNIYPYANLKQKNLLHDFRKKKPALALVPGNFNTDIPGFNIKFERSDGEPNNFLRNVQIADISDNEGKKKIITAKTGEILSEEGSKYMTFVLKDGYFYEDAFNKRKSRLEQSRMPFQKASFERYTINIDISDFSDQSIGKDEKIKDYYNMLTLNQLNKSSDSLKIIYDKYLETKAKNIFLKTKAKDLHQYTDSLIPKNMNPDILSNFPVSRKAKVVDNAIQNVRSALNTIRSYKDIAKSKRKILNQYDFEYSNRISFSLACLVLFFIGAPLGSIIRKGGFGLPMILAIIIFVSYYFLNTFGKNLSEESAVPSNFGSWIATIVLLPFGVLLTIRATNDKSMFNFTDSIYVVKKNVLKLKNKITAQKHK